MIRSTSRLFPRHVFVYLQVMWTFLTWVVVLYGQGEPGIARTGTVLEVALLANLLWTAASWRGVGGDLFGPYVIFVCAAAMFNSGQSFLELFGLNAGGLLDSRFQPEVLARTEAFVLASSAAIHLGAMLSFRHQPVGVISTSESELTWSRRIGALMLVVAVPATALVLIPALRVVAAGGYQSLYQQDVVLGLDAAPRILASLAVPGAMFLLVGGRRHPLAKMSSAVVIMLVACSQLALGYRAAGTMPLAMYTWLWHRSVKRVPLAAVLGCAAVLLIAVFPTLAIIRGFSGDERLSLDAAAKTFSALESPFVASVAEMGNSMSTVAYTMEFVPESRPFDLGLSYWYAALTALPNMFWEIHPSIQHGYASRWLIEIVDPSAASHGGGIGYSHIAEAYLNFGMFSWLPLMLLGTLLGVAERWACRSTLTRAAAMASAFGFVLFVVRAESAAVVRSLLWFAAAPYAAVAFAVRVPLWNANTPTLHRATIAPTQDGAFESVRSISLD